MNLLSAPALGNSTVQLHPFQADAVEAVEGEFQRGVQSTLVVMPTGTGKTITFGMIARRAISVDERVLVLAHRDELIDQTAESLSLLGIDAMIEKSGRYARSLYDPHCVIASVQTMQRKRLESWSPDYFQLLITDECHHSTADTYQAIYNHFSQARHLGVTATADRADDETLTTVFDSVAYEYSLWDAMTAEPPGPYLCRLQADQCEVQIDLRGIGTTGGDFNRGELEERIRPLVGVLANAIRQEIDDRTTLVFTPDVGSAQAMASALQSLGFRADWVSGDDPERRRKIQDLKDGKLQVLCNCALLTEGFNCPPISAIVLCRPTKSRPLYAQMVGRGTRLSPGKTNCLIVDFACLTSKHDLVTPLELFLGRDADPELFNVANQSLKSNPKQDLLEAIENAREAQKRAREEKAERQRIALKVQEQSIQYKRTVFDPLTVHRTLGMIWSQPSHDAKARKATDRQVQALGRFGVENANTLTIQAASNLLEHLINRAQKERATHKQVLRLIKLGIDPETARSLHIRDASDLIGKLLEKRA